MSLIQGPIDSLKHNPLGFIIILVVIFIVLGLRKKIEKHGGNAGRTFLKVSDFFSTLRIILLLILLAIFGVFLLSAKK